MFEDDNVEKDTNQLGIQLTHQFYTANLISHLLKFDSIIRRFNYLPVDAGKFIVEECP